MSKQDRDTSERWSHPWIFRFCCMWCRIVFALRGGLKYVGTENIPEQGGIIVASNHISLADPPAVSVKLKRQVHFMAKEELFKPFVLGHIMYWSGMFPVRRGTPDRKAIRRALQYLEEGHVVGIFPEGTRSEDGKLKEPELGIGLIALKARVPVVPVAVVGSDKMLPPHSMRFHHHPVTVYYGKPISFPDLYDSKDSRAAIEEIGRRTMAAIAEIQAEHS